MDVSFDLLNTIQDEFTKRCGPCVVAGGCVRDVLMGREPKDYDVFVFNNAEPLANTCWDGLEVIDSPEWHKSEPHLQATVRFNGAIVQIMASECKSLKELVGNFDWNVSAFGYSQHETPNVFEGSKTKDIGEGKMLRLLKVTYPVSSLRRGFRFSERFGMKFDTVELRDLCVMAAGRLTECEWGVKR